jgi:hypothetical protein
VSDGLKPGDLCVVLASDHCSDVQCRKIFGRYVVLLEESTWLRGQFYAPYWTVTNVKDVFPEGLSISHEILQKLPPPPGLEEDERDEEELLA